MAARRESGLARRIGETGLGIMSPWAELEQVRGRMDDLFSRFFGYTPLSRLIGPTVFQPVADICESSDSVMVDVYIPGLSREQVDLSVTSNTVTVSGEWKAPYADRKDVVCHMTGFGTGKFEAAYTLPVEIDPNKCKAVYRNGVLQITLPKTEAYKTRSVHVRVEE